MFIPEINFIVCYSLLATIKLNIRFKNVFVIKSCKKVRIFNTKCQFVLSNGLQILASFIRLHIQSERSTYHVAVFQKYKICTHSFLICFAVYSCDKTRILDKTWTKEKSCINHFSCCHCNVNGIAAHDYKKVLLLETYNTIYYWNLICISETHLDSSVSNDKKKISIKGYSLVREDHPSNTKRRDVCIYYKKSPDGRIVAVLTESIICQITITKTVYVLAVYCSPHNPQMTLKKFSSSFDQVTADMILSNPAFKLVLGDFNQRWNSWWDGDI